MTSSEELTEEGKAMIVQAKQMDAEAQREARTRFWQAEGVQALVVIGFLCGIVSCLVLSGLRW